MTTTASGKDLLSTALSTARSRLVTLMDATTLPVNLRPLATQLGVVGLKRSRLAVDAMLVAHGGGYLAIVNRDNEPGAQRFALAHEIAHLLLNAVDHRFGAGHRAASLRGSHDEVEFACDRLASDMLMPRAAVIDRAEAHGWQFRAVETISADFFVDVEHAAERMMEFSPLQNALTTWRRGPRNELALVRGKSNVNKPQVLGIDRRLSIIDIPSACRAYTQEGIFRGLVPFEVLVAPNTSLVTQYFETESQGVGSGAARLVRSLANLLN